MSTADSPSELANRRKTIMADFRRAAEVAERNPVSSVGRLASSTPDGVRELLGRSMPVVLTGVMNEWPAPRWSFAELCAKYGDALVAGPDGRARGFTSLIEETLRAGRGFGGYDLPEQLRSAISVPVPGLAYDDTPPVFFCGSQGWAVPLHRDPTNIINAQLIGQKRWILFSPDQADHLYPRFDPVRDYQTADVKPEAPDLVRFPLFRRARRVEVTVRAGEALLLPLGWFHEVHVESASFALGFDLSISPGARGGEIAWGAGRTRDTA